VRRRGRSSLCHEIKKKSKIKRVFEEREGFEKSLTQKKRVEMPTDEDDKGDQGRAAKEGSKVSAPSPASSQTRYNTRSKKFITPMSVEEEIAEKPKTGSEEGASNTGDTGDTGDTKPAKRRATKKSTQKDSKPKIVRRARKATVKSQEGEAVDGAPKKSRKPRKQATKKGESKSESKVESGGESKSEIKSEIKSESVPIKEEPREEPKEDVKVEVKQEPQESVPEPGSDVKPILEPTGEIKPEVKSEDVKAQPETPAEPSAPTPLTPTAPTPSTSSPTPDPPPGPSIEDKVKIQEEKMLQVLRTAGVPEKQVAATAQDTNVILQAATAWNEMSNKITPENVATIKAAATSVINAQHSTKRRIKQVIDSKETLDVVRGIESTLSGNIGHDMNPIDRNALEDMLESYDLAIGKPRQLQLTCNYQAVEIPGVNTLSQSQVSDFLDMHPMHHLGIFSINRGEDTFCFYVEDLMRLLVKRKLRSMDVQKMTEAEWEGAKISSGKFNFTGKECLLVIEWYNAYAHFKELIGNLKDREIVRNLRKYADHIVPHVSSKGVWGVLRRVGRSFKRQIQGMWKLIATKFLVDIITCVSCVAVFVYATYSGAVMAGISQIFLPAIQKFIFGAISLKVYAFFIDMFDGKPSYYFQYVTGAVSGVFEKMGWTTVATTVDASAAAFGATTPYSANAGTLVGLGALATLTAKATVAVVGVGAFGAIGTPVAAAFAGLSVLNIVSASSLLFMGVRHAADYEFKAKATMVTFNTFNPLGQSSTGIGPLFQMLASGTVCNLIETIMGSHRARLCKYAAASLTRLGLVIEITRAIVDLLVFWVRLHDQTFLQDEYKSTRCEEVYAPFDITKVVSQSFFLEAFDVTKTESVLDRWHLLGTGGGTSSPSK